MQYDIYTIFLKLKQREENSSDLSILFRLMFNISRGYLTRSKKKFVFNSSVLPEDAVMEIITPLFSNENNRQFDKLLTAFERWSPPIENEKDALFFLHQLIFIRCEHYLINLIRKNNPEVTSIINQLNSRIKERGYKKQHYFGTLYIVKKEIISTGDCLISREDFDRIPDHSFAPAQLPDSLFNYLVENNFSEAIPYYYLVEKMSWSNYRGSNDNYFDETLSQNIYVEEAADEGLNVCYSKLIESYGNKNKLNPAEIDSFRKALSEVRMDLTNGGISGGYYEYLLNHMPHLSHEEFKLKYENIFEYLIKILKQATLKVLKEQ